MNTDQSIANITPEVTISEIMCLDNRAGELLASIGLSLSEHEQETLRSVCEQRKWSEIEVLNWLKKHSSTTNGEARGTITTTVPEKDAPLTKWTTYVEASLISSNRSLLEELEENFPRIKKIHGTQYPWLKMMQWHFDQFKEVLGMYYSFEQNKFFPLIERLKRNNNNSLSYGTIQKLQKSFTIIERDQSRLRDIMEAIREKGKQFKNPRGACSTLRIQNNNFSILFLHLKEQFKVEKEQLLPRVKKEIKAKS